jgi:uncharacterized protein
MHIEGTYTLQALPREVWNCLMDQQVLLRTVPGIERIEQVDKDSYAVAIRINQAPFVDTYNGRVTVTEQQYPYHYRLAIEGEGRQSTISGSGSVHLNERDGSTIIAYQGSLSVSKAGVRLPLSLIKGAAKLFIQQYFTALADQLHTLHANAEALSADGMEQPSILKNESGNIVILPPAPATTAGTGLATKSVFATIVHVLRLGAGDPEQEARWENRLRRASVISVLLFLVWVGTRLPRRR